MASKLNWYAVPAKRFVDDLIGKAFRAGGAAWVEQAREDAPVDTGQLRDAIGYIYDASSRRLILYCDVSYALFQEFGTKFHKAQEFMRPALSAIPRLFRGMTTLQAANTPENAAAGIESDNAGKTRGAKLQAGRRKFR